MKKELTLEQALAKIAELEKQNGILSRSNSAYKSARTVNKRQLQDVRDIAAKTADDLLKTKEHNLNMAVEIESLREQLATAKQKYETYRDYIEKMPWYKRIFI